MPRLSVVPIFLVTDQQMHTGSMWKMASPISHRKLSTPLQNWLTSTRVLVPFSSRYMLSIQLRKPRIKPPVIMMGISGAKISARALMTFWARFWFCLAALLTASFETPSMPDTATKSL